MPTSQLPIPINGYTDSMNHQHGAEGFVTSCLNVVPIDNWENRRRIGTRQGFRAIADMGSEDDKNVQLLLTYEVYRNGSLLQEVLIVAGGDVYYAKDNGDTVDVGYKTTGAVGSVVFTTGVPVADELITLISTDESTDTYTAKAAEALASQEFNMTTANAIATFTFGETEFDDTTTDTTIQLIDGEGSPTTKTYTLITDATSGTNFQRKATANLTAAEFKAVVEGSNGHNGTILVITNSTDGKVTLVQKTGGTDGNTAITDGAGWLTICSVNPPAAFAGGAAAATNITVADSLQRCIEYNTTNVLYEKITVANDGAGTLTLTQAVAGLDGHTAIVETLTTATKTDFANTGVHADDVIQSFDTVRGVQFGTSVYLVNGRHYYKIDLSETTPEIVLWVDTGSGEVPRDEAGNSCTLITVFGGRVVLAGLLTSRNNWFLSRIGDAEDWEYDDGGAGPHAGDTSTDFGKLGDPITAIFPFGETGLMFASRNALTYLSGDPVIPGSVFTRLSNGVGVMNADAWCQGPEKSAYIVSDDGVYQLMPNQFNVQRGQSVTTGRLDGLFSTISTDEVDFRLSYEPSRQTVYLFINRPADPVGVIHYQYHIPTRSWWTFKTDDIRMDVLKTFCLYSPVSGERAGLWFGMDSGRIVVVPNTGVTSTDGDAFEDPLRSTGDNSPTASASVFTSRLAWSPINSGLSNRRILMTELDILLDNHEFPQPDGFESEIVDPRLTLYGADMAQTLSGVSGSIEVVEALTVIDGNVTGSTVEGGDSTNPGRIGYSLRAEVALTLNTTAIATLDTLTLTLEDYGEQEVTITFDSSIPLLASTATTCGISDLDGDATAILSAIKVCMDYNRDAGDLLIETEEPSSNTMLMRLDEEGTTMPAATSGTVTPYIPAVTFAGANHEEFIDGGLSSGVGGTYDLTDASLAAPFRVWNLGSTYKVNKSGSLTPDQHNGIWGIYEQGNVTVAEYLAASVTSTVPESTMTSLEIMPTGHSRSTATVSLSQDSAGKRELQTWDIIPGRNNRYKMRKRESDFQVEILATGTTWVLEDIAATIDDGGSYRNVV